MVDTEQKLAFLSKTLTEILGRRKLTGVQQQKLMKLIIAELREVYQQTADNGKTKKNLGNTEVQGKDWIKGLRHNPKQTTEILRKFKYNNDSGFKELVHKPTDEENYTIDNFKEVIQKAENYFKTLKDIHPSMYHSIRQLIELMKNEGMECFEETGKHPYQNGDCKKIMFDKIAEKYGNLRGGYKRDASITELIQNFKKNYRFDEGKSEASKLMELINNILGKREYEDSSNSKKYRFVSNEKEGEKNDQIIYLKHRFSHNFNRDAVFLTWVPNISVFLSNIMDDILKHGNLNGERDFSSGTKEVEFSVERGEDGTIKFVVFDKKSIVKKDKKYFYKDIKEKSKHLISICDWRIEADFNEGSYSINILPEKNETFEKIDKVNGLKHILTFYE